MIVVASVSEGTSPIAGPTMLVTIAAISYIVVTLLSAIGLWLASRWLGIGRLSYDKALRASATANLVLWTFAGMIFLSGLLLRSGVGESVGRYDSGLELSYPLNLTLLLPGIVLIQAVVFLAMCAETGGRPLRFGRATALALVSMGFNGVWAVPAILAGVMLKR